MHRIREEDDEASWVDIDASSKISSWSDDTDLAERIKREREKMRKQQIKDVFKRMQAAKNLDLCFMVDVTGSMGPHINAVKEQIHAIVDKLTTTQNLRFMVDMNDSTQISTVVNQIHTIADKLKTSNSLLDLIGSVVPHISKIGEQIQNVVHSASSSIVKKIRLAFVGYRDFGDSSQFEVLDFCESVDNFHEFCKQIRAVGGGDAAEDVFGGLEKAIGLNWSTDGSTRMLFHIADAPCHGSAYNDFSREYDRYPDGDPGGRSINSLLLGELRKKDIEYHFGRITNYTDKMINEFSKIYGEEIVVCDIKDPDLLHDSIISSSSIAVSKVGPSVRTMQFAATLPYDRAEPNWDAVAKTAGLFLTYEFSESMQEIFNGVPLNRKQPVKAIVQLAPKPFAKGMERVAYYGRDVSSPSKPIDIVLKKYTTATGFINSTPQYEGAIQLQTIAAYLASFFTADTLEKSIHNSIKFLKGQVFTYKDPSTGRNIFMSCERRYPIGCDFLRFSNNFDYSMLEETAKAKGVDPKFVEQLMAFSHWTYQISRGYLMVVDLQGIICTETSGRKSIELTDPAIHCTDLTRFGRTNLGIKGMKSFFSRHVCNQVCAKMGLDLPPATMMMGVDVDE